jgi:hypothetical protein
VEPPIIRGAAISDVNVISTRGKVLVSGSSQELGLNVTRSSSKIPAGASGTRPLAPAPLKEVTGTALNELLLVDEFGYPRKSVFVKVNL